MDQYLSEIQEQPIVARRMVEEWTINEELNRIAKLYRASPRTIVFVGMGSSNYAPVILRSRLSKANIPFQILEAGELVHYELDSVPTDAWVLAISQSGESFETCTAVKALKGKVERIIAITNESESTLARLADISLYLNAGKEVGSTTKTFINTLLGLHLFANALEGNTLVSENEIEQCFSFFDEIHEDMRIKSNEIISALGISASNAPDPVHIITRGQMLATAQQSALILAETTDLFVDAMAGGTFRHGPFELAGSGQHRAIVLAPSGKTQHLLLGIAKQLHQMGSKVVLISDTREEVPFYKLSMPTIGEEMAPLLYFLPIELFGWNLAQLRGRVPGMMRNMGKVTTVE
jgi:glutamine---fructose-6-phosphate transaminase (isomerizing)